MFKGRTIRLKVRTKTGTDEFNRNVYSDEWVEVKNVLYGQPTAEDAATTLNLTGKHATLTLGIPKGDTHDWTDTEVEIAGVTYRTIGMPQMGIEEMVPGPWHYKVQVERYEQ